MKVVPSPLVASLHGSAAGVTAATWKGRQYIRRKVVPANPNTAGQQAVRESLTRCVTLWRSLGTVVKAWLNKYGADYRMSGYNTFMSKNRALEQVPSLLKVVPDNPYVKGPGSFAYDSEPTATTLKVIWVDDVISGFTKMFLIMRQTDLVEFDLEILTVDASTDLYIFDPVISGKTYDLYAAYYNPTTGDIGTIASVQHVQT